MRGKVILTLLVAMLVLGLFGVSGGWDPIIGMGFLSCLLALLFTIGDLGDKQGKSDLNQTRPKQF